jgi:NodT family efflux transporter outer membrane factor (OMF) lipoprotein
LGDPLLDTLVARALSGNPDIDAAAARIRQARASLRERKAAGLPAVNSSALYAKARLPGQSASGGSSNLELYNLGFDSSWELDLFGGQHRAVEAARADVEAREASLDDARVSLSAEVAQTYVDLRDRQQRVALAGASLALRDQAIALTRQRFESGTATRSDLLLAEKERDEAQAQIEPLKADIDGQKDKLAILTGALPGALDGVLDNLAPVPLPPPQVAVDDPAALIRRRPDIRAAERTLAAQTARIGQADAARFPRVSFLGLIGLGGATPGDIFDLDKIVLAAAPRLSWNFLDFGRGRAKVRGAEAQRDEAAARYRATVLGALQDAEGALSRFQHQRVVLAELVQAERHASEAGALARQRREAGTISLIDYLAARRMLINATLARQQASAALTSTFIALQKAFGLGWQGLDATATPPATSQP